LYFDTTNDIMKVYDLTNNQWRQLTLTTTNQNNVNTVAGAISNVNTVAGANSNITTVASDISDINTVAGISSNVTTVAGISSNVTSVAGNSTNINSAVSNATNINTVAGAISNVNTVGSGITNVNTVASNISGVNSFAERYRVQSGVPSSDNDVGDLVFDTAANTLKVFGSSGFQNAGSSVNGTSDRFTYNITGTPTTLTGASGTGFAEAGGKTLAYDAGFLDVYLNGVKMVNGTDVTVTSGDSVVFASALSNGDVVDIVTFGTFQVATLNASNLASGTVPVARVSGSYTGITGTGALNAGSITSGFGNIDNGSSTLTTGNSDINGTLNVQGETTLQTHLNMGDNDTIKLGDSADLQIYHDGSNSVILDNGTGEFLISTNGNFIRLGTSTGEAMIDAVKDGASTLYHDNSAKLATTSSGVTVTGGVQTTQINTGSSTGTLTIFGGATNKGGTIEMSGGNNTGSDGAGIVFKTGASTSSPSERVRINNNGATGFGTSSNEARIGVEADSGVLVPFLINSTASGTGGTTIQIFRRNGTNTGGITITGSTSSFVGSSDYRLKENVSYNFDATSRLKELKPCRFNFKIDTNTTVDGFLAHEVSHDADGNPLVPEAVFGEKDATNEDGSINPQGIDQSKLVPLLVKTIQELEARITALESA